MKSYSKWAAETWQKERPCKAVKTMTCMPLSADPLCRKCYKEECSEPEEALNKTLDDWAKILNIPRSRVKVCTLERSKHYMTGVTLHTCQFMIAKDRVGHNKDMPGCFNCGFFKHPNPEEVIDA